MLLEFKIFFYVILQVLRPAPVPVLLTRLSHHIKTLLSRRKKLVNPPLNSVHELAQLLTIKSFFFCFLNLQFLFISFTNFLKYATSAAYSSCLYCLVQAFFIRNLSTIDNYDVCYGDFPLPFRSSLLISSYQKALLYHVFAKPQSRSISEATGIAHCAET